MTKDVSEYMIGVVGAVKPADTLVGPPLTTRRRQKCGVIHRFATANEVFRR
jgi:hypothetical protein